MFRTLLLALCILGLAGGGGYLWMRHGSGAVLLEDHGGARWIRPGEPYWFGVRKAGPRVATFRKSIVLEAPSAPVLALEALKLAQVRIDGRLIYSQQDPSAWREEHRVELGSLAPGTHELTVTVLNQSGPDALRIASETPGLDTGRDWESSRDQRDWSAVALATEFHAPELSLAFETPAAALRRFSWFFAPLFLLVFAWSWIVQRQRAPAWLASLTPSPAGVRWLLLAMGTVLFLNDAPKLPLDLGFDAKAHLDYIRFVAERGRLPLAGDGWQMFQAPLYYALSAPLYLLSNSGPVMLRLISFACAAAQIELAYRTMRALFPGRADLQALGTALGGLLPMILYSSFSIGNEPLAGALSAAAIARAAVLAARATSPSPRHLAGVGCLLGLAALSKVSALLALLPVTALLAVCSQRRWRAVAIVLATAALVAGWYYLRNWIQLGTPLVASSYGRVSLGGDAAGGEGAWWQDPGYRTPAQLFSFGAALCHPIFAGLAGFCDGFYSSLWLDGQLSSRASVETCPPWNYAFLASQAWLSAPLTICMLVGAWRALAARGSTSRLPRFFLACLGLYLLAVFTLFLRLPIYSVVKATYTLGVVPCYAALACLGLEAFSTRPAMRAAVHGCVVCWAVSSYLGYFIV